MTKKHNPKTMTDTPAQPASLNLEARVKLCSQPLAYGSAQLMAFAELVVGGAFVIRDIRILRVAKDGEDSVFVAFPSRRWNADGGDEKKYYDVAFPITAQAYREATGALLQEYERLAALEATKPS
jgi:DNA-binding cell septation regulator SpoVG